jgi:tetratricopeptide (TPR) repeat protein
VKKMVQERKRYILLAIFLISIIPVNSSSNELSDSRNQIMMAAAPHESTDLERALVYADFACKENPNSPNTWTVKAAYLLDLGRYDDAIENCNIAISKDPNFAPAWATKGVILFSKGNEKEGEDCWNKSIELDSSFVEHVIMEDVARQEIENIKSNSANTVRVAQWGIIIRKLAVPIIKKGLPAVKNALISISNFVSKNKGNIAFAAISIIPQISPTPMINSSANISNLNHTILDNPIYPIQVFKPFR